ncbi:MAG: hypothetical protein LBV80_10980 [Deltaproteobacteria bacterium]|jgi:hypothetical protein|nr:hypothetical protein [Deltaproteobacteria bacterium]
MTLQLDEEAGLRLANLEKALNEAKTQSERELAEKERVIHGLLVENAFASSAFLREKTVLPPDFAYANLGRHFSVEYRDGLPQVIARDDKGKPIFSPANPSAYASPEEAIRILVEKHPRRESLLKAANPRGGSGSRAGGLPGGRVVSLRQLKSPEEKARFISENGLEAYKALKTI